jgi:hypothetical protein
VSASSPAPALSRFLGAGLHLSQLSHFRGPAHSLALTSVEINGFTDNAPTGVATPNGLPLTYSFVKAFTVLNGDLESITGDFGFDPLSDIQYAANINLTGPAPYAGNYFFDIELEGPNFIYTDRGGGIFLKISFANDLSSCADPLAGTTYQTPGPGFIGNAPASGLVVPAAGVCAVPEPTSIALLGAALGLLLLGLPIARDLT